METLLPTSRAHRDLIACGLPWIALCAFVVTGVWLAAKAYCYHHADLGIYGQALAGLSRGAANPFLSGRNIRVFNDHFDPILFVVAPLARLMPPWQAALAGELAMVSLAALPLLWLVRRWSLDFATSLLLASLLFLEPAVVRAVRFPVHPTTWAMAPMMLVVAALLLERWWVMMLGLLLLFACKEEFPFCGLMLGLTLWQRHRRVASGVLALSVGWVLLAFVVRPWIMGPTWEHGPGVFSGLFDDPWSYSLQRLTARGLASGLWDFALPLLPLFVWMATRRARWNLPLLALALAPMAIRFLGMSWRHHYMAALVPVAIGLVASAARERPFPRGLIAASFALILALDAASVRFTLSRLGAPIAAEPRFCPATPERLVNLDAAIETLRDTTGPALVSPNLFPQLAAKEDVYALAGFQPGDTRYRWLLLEKPPNGDPYPMSAEHLSTLIPELRAQATSVLVDDERLLFAEGSFIVNQP